jgi:peptide deformylase
MWTQSGSINQKAMKKSQKPSNASLYRIRTFGDPTLRQQAHEVTEFDDKLAQLVEVMFELMDEADGVGLAATQIGVQKQVVVWRHPETDERYVIVNPRFLERSTEIETGSEGCLSVPGCTLDVPRSSRVKIEAYDHRGQPYGMEAEGLLARILQHEMDHLEGRLIIDRATPEDRRRVLKQLRDKALET